MLRRCATACPTASRCGPLRRRSPRATPGFTCQEVTHDYQQSLRGGHPLLHGFRLGRRRSEHGLRVDRSHAGHRPALLWRARHRRRPGRRLPVSRAVRRRRLHEARGVRRADRRSRPASFTKPGCPASPPRWRASELVSQQSLLCEGRYGDAALLHRFRPAGGAHAPECGTVSAICGMLKAPLDILADKLRGYIDLAFDLKEIPEKVLAACEALMPHLGYLALTGADPARQVPIPIWMHRGCVPFISRRDFDDYLLAHAEADRRSALGAGQPGAVLCRRQMGRASGSLRRTARRQHRLSPRPHATRNWRTAFWAEVLPQRRRAECAAGVRHSGRSEGALQVADRDDSAPTAATSWTPAPSCRTTPRWRTSAP